MPAACQPCWARIRTSPRPTSRILPGATAYQTDVGMTGPHDSILGRRYDRVLSSTLTAVPHYFDVAAGDPRLNAALIEVDPDNGHALSIARVSINHDESAGSDRNALTT